MRESRYYKEGYGFIRRSIRDYKVPKDRYCLKTDNGIGTFTVYGRNNETSVTLTPELSFQDMLKIDSALMMAGTDARNERRSFDDIDLFLPRKMKLLLWMHGQLAGFGIHNAKIDQKLTAYMKTNNTAESRLLEYACRKIVNMSKNCGTALHVTFRPLTSKKCLTPVVDILIHADGHDSTTDTFIQVTPATSADYIDCKLSAFWKGAGLQRTICKDIYRRRIL